MVALDRTKKDEHTKKSFSDNAVLTSINISETSI